MTASSTVLCNPAGVLRNSRPIALINTDYKLLASIQAELMDCFIGPRQTGRQVTENTSLCQLLHASLEEGSDSLFLDLEKAFEGVSHEYPREALKAVSVGGKDMRLWTRNFLPMTKTPREGGFSSMVSYRENTPL